MNYSKIYYILYLFTSRISKKWRLKVLVNLFSIPPTKKKKPIFLDSSVLRDFIEINGKETITYNIGNSESLVIFVHGWGGEFSNFTFFVKPILSNNFEITSFDAPAHGNSKGINTNINEFKNVLIEILNKNKNKKINIICHSLGGAAAILAINTSANIHINKLVLINTPTNLFEMLLNFARLLKLRNYDIIDIEQSIIKKYNLNLKTNSIINIKKPTNIGDILLIHDYNDKQIDCKNTIDLGAFWKISPENIIITQNLGHFKILSDTTIITKIISFINN